MTYHVVYGITAVIYLGSFEAMLFSNSFNEQYSSNFSRGCYNSTCLSM